MPTPTSVDAYLASCPPAVRPLLEQLRQLIRKAAPQAVECIKYQMPTYVQHGNLLSFGLYKTHIGLYPIPAGDAAFQVAVAPYRAAKSTLRFPLTKPLPLALIRQIVQFRVAENQAKARARKK